MKFSKVLVSAAIAVTAVTANAATDQEVGQALAVCSGDLAFIGAMQIKGNNTKEGQQYIDLSVAFYKAASAKIGKDAADQIGANVIRSDTQKIQSNQPGAAEEISNRALKSCPVIGKGAGVAQYLK